MPIPAGFARLWRLTPLIAMAIAVLLLGMGLLVVYSGEQSYRQRKADEVRAEARILASTVVAALTFDDKKAAQGYVDALGANPETEAAVVYGKTGLPFVTYQRDRESKLPASSPAFGIEAAADRVAVTTPVEEGGSVIGSVYVRAILEPFSRRLERYAVIGVLVVMGALLTVALGIAQSTLNRTNRELAATNVDLQSEIAEREKAEEALRQAQKMEAIGQLTGGVAHDFNNILQVILGNLGTVELQLQRSRAAEPEALRRPIQAAIRGADRAAVLVRQLLAFSRRQPLAPKPIDANRLISGMSDLLHRTLGETIEVETIKGAGLWQTVADANQLESAVLNLAVNARDAMPEGGKLTIETANAYLDEVYATREEDVRPGQYVIIAVSDTGIGMSPEIIRKAFDPFFTTKDIGQGTGLGLSQVYGFLKQSGGHAKIYSEVGEGTTVKLYLPRMASDAAPAAEAATPGIPPAKGAHEAILVVEDETDVREFEADMLRELGYDVIEAPDGRAALSALENRPDIRLLFTDVGLPGGINGRQLAEQARRLRPSLKVLFTTGYARNAIVHQGRLDPGVRLLVKPFSYAALAARIREMLDGADHDGW